MAKQTFTSGQVLTAAQMTSLQQTAMLGGSASAKTDSYTLVAADAGKAITMDKATATTITVNTNLFAAGDTVTILNIGAGTCTITAGTATVSKPTGATLALVTSAGGVLYFTATGAATFMPFDAGGGAYTSIASGSLAGASLDLTTISASYRNLQLILRDFYPSADDYLRFSLNNTTGIYGYTGPGAVDTGATQNYILPFSTVNTDNTNSVNFLMLEITDYTNTTTAKSTYSRGFSLNTSATTWRMSSVDGLANTTSAIDRITFSWNGGATFSGGTYELFGVK